MKRLLHILSLSLLTTWASAQAIIVTDDNNNEIPNNGTVTFTISSNDLSSEENGFFETKFLVKNNTQESKNWTIQRDIIEVPNGWTDGVCWPPTCFLTNGATSFTTPSCSNPNSQNFNEVVIEPNSSNTNQFDWGTSETYAAYIKPNIYPNNSVGNATYRYRVVDCTNDEIVFTFDIVVSFTLNATTIKKDAAIVLAPNPATDVVTVSIPDNGNGSIQMVDVLGNVVYQADFTGSRKINTAQFKNGVYFVVITSNGVRSNKKLVIRH